MMKNQVVHLLKRGFSSGPQLLTDAGWKICPWIAHASSRGYLAVPVRQVQLQDLDRRLSSPSITIWQNVANSVKLQSSLAMPVEEDHNDMNAEKRVLDKQESLKNHLEISQYWGIAPKEIVREDGTAWPWNCFTPTEVHLTDLKIDLTKHHKPESFSDKLALWIVKSLRVPTDILFRKRYGCRAMMLETVAAVPGMVGGVLLHLRSLRRFEYSGGWIKALLEEAENERMHLMTFMEVAKPAWYERALVFTVQGIFFNAYFLMYLVSPRVAHRIVGYLEEEAIYSYTEYLKEIDKGHLPNIPAPAIAIDYWRLPKDAKIRDVVTVVRADEAHHRDVNHFASDIKKHGMELRESPAPLEYH